MSNIRVEVNCYKQSKQYVAMVLYTDMNNETASVCYYPTGKREATRILKALEAQYNVEGIINT
ncbi:MAG: hypothetical protein AUG51_12975 [Acidobacteria bacterium 13_1_20CM_3_53_8]|nr:MAG: hypothetical protein AUG51_12975 [Acidobacteria bacterium 13_1_20CM_3_53_8]